MLTGATGPGNFLCIFIYSKNLGFKNKIRLERLNLVLPKTLKSVFHGDLNYICVLPQGFSHGSTEASKIKFQSKFR